MDKKDYWFKAQAVVRKGKHEKVLTIGKCEVDLSTYASCDGHAGGELTLQMPVSAKGYAAGTVTARVSLTVNWLKVSKSFPSPLALVPGLRSRI